MEQKTIKLMPLNQHWYPSPKKKGVFYPGVTMVCGFLPKGQFFDKYLAEQDSWEESQRILMEAAERGRKCHTASEVLDKGGTIEYATSGLTDEEYALMVSYLAWHSKFSPVIDQTKIELRLISDKLKLGGTCDRVYIIDGKRVLFDLKTSKSAIFDSHWIQVACYAAMYEELHKEQIDEVAILRLTSKRKDGYEYVTKDRTEWLADFKQFKATYATMMYLNKGKPLLPKIITVPEVLTLNE